MIGRAIGVEDVLFVVHCSQLLEVLLEFLRKDLLSEEEVESPTIENVLELILAGAGNDAEVLEEEVNM